MKRCPDASLAAGHNVPAIASGFLAAFPASFRAAALAALIAAATLSAAVVPAPAQAQTTPGAAPANPLDQRSRQFPADARRGILQVAAANVIQMDGKPDRLAPGARIRDAQNRIVLTGALVGQTLRVNYTRETGGQVHEVWILTAEEAAQKRAGNNDLVQRNFRFASED